MRPAPAAIIAAVQRRSTGRDAHPGGGPPWQQPDNVAATGEHICGGPHAGLRKPCTGHAAQCPDGDICSRDAICIARVSIKGGARLAARNKWGHEPSWNQRSGDGIGAGGPVHDATAAGHRRQLLQSTAWQQRRGGAA